MLSTRWLAKRKPHWAQLTELLERARKRGVTALTHRELQELGLLYRQTAGDLAAVREDPKSQTLHVYLNQLLGRAHNLIYMGRRGNPSNIARFYVRVYPHIFRATFAYTLTAFIIFLAGTVVGFLATLGDASFSRYLLGPHMSDKIERREMWTDSILTVKARASSEIMTNNLSVSFAMFAFGITAGLGTCYLLALNGLLFGVILAACWQAGMLSKVLAFVAGHGMLELPAIFIAGGAGLLIARGWLFPGLLPRRDSLAEASGQAIRLMLGTIPMLFVAGIVEAFVSPTALPAYLKFLFSVALGGAFFGYLLTAGRNQGEVINET